MKIFKGIGLALAVSMTAAPAVAGAGQQVSYPSDAGLDCEGLAVEIGRAEESIGQANRAIAGADGQARGAGLAGTVAVEGMLRTGVLGRAPGLGMFANQAANFSKQRAAANQAQAAEVIRVAETRRAMLMGMASGKGCSQAAAVPPPQALPNAQGAAPVGLLALPPEATRHY